MVPGAGRGERFLEDYQYPQEDINRLEAASELSPASLMKLFFEIIRDQKIYLMIDEYDHFANSLLGTSLERFQEIIGRGGFVRSFYETIKTATMEGIVDRFFITGVTSITLDSLTSGFNIGNNITHHQGFNQAIGFTHEEVATTIQPLVTACDLEQPVPACRAAERPVPDVPR
ncbi:MAG: AAA family ATPase [Candidatus Electrothrix sp. GW3-4]|uniref:AAA family ATPase n=1 Tax=Candidatus Electrothrix sp. GW3-4 TaxID=3126740 RepID=UPI0030CC10E7